MKRICYLLVFVLLSALQVNAQTKGRLSYTLEFSSDDPETAMSIGMMQNSKLDLFFIPGKSKAVIVMGSIMQMSTTIDVKAKKGLITMDMMGQKSATPITLNDKDKKPKSTYAVVSENAGSKEILGFKCTKTILKDENGPEVEVWVTKDLKATLEGLDQLDQFGIDGVPLEFSLEENNMKMYFIANKFDKMVDEKLFSLDIPEGYTIMTEEELESMGQ